MQSIHIFLNFLFFFGLSSLGKEENVIISVLTGSPGIGCLRVSVGCYSFLRGPPRWCSGNESIRLVMKEMQEVLVRSLGGEDPLE